MSLEAQKATKDVLLLDNHVRTHAILSDIVRHLESGMRQEKTRCAKLLFARNSFLKFIHFLPDFSEAAGRDDSWSETLQVALPAFLNGHLADQFGFCGLPGPALAVRARPGSVHGCSLCVLHFERPSRLTSCDSFSEAAAFAIQLCFFGMSG